MPILYKYLNADGTFNLSAALYERCSELIGKPAFNRALQFIDEVEELSPIRNLEAAAIAYSYAANIARSRS